MVKMPGYLTNSALDYQKSPYLVDTDDYKVELMDIQPVQSMKDSQTKFPDLTEYSIYITKGLRLSQKT